MTSQNPFDELINDCHNDAKELEHRYAVHRERRNEQQKAKLLAKDFPGMKMDTILQRIEDPSIEPGFKDSRHSLVFWARPPPHIKDLIGQVQEMLREAAPHLWTMPRDCLHLTVMELTHSVPQAEVDEMIKIVEKEIPKIVEFPQHHPAQLYKPLLSIDGEAIALTFLPKADPSNYTYHQLRGDVWQMSMEAGAKVNSRYIAPSAHLTVGRFIHPQDLDSPEKIAKWVAKIEEVNAFLAGADEAVGTWTVCGERGLDCRHGALWYGGGVSI